MKRMTVGKARTQVRVAFHPMPEAETIIADWVIRVERGPIGYQTSDGVIHQP